MAKTAKKPSSGSSRDLFDASEAAARRAAGPGKPARNTPAPSQAGGKLGFEVYSPSGGLYGVGVSVVNALSVLLEVEAARGGQLCRQVYERGKPKSGLEKLGKAATRRGPRVRFKPDPDIFGA